MNFIMAPNSNKLLKVFTLIVVVLLVLQYFYLSFFDLQWIHSSLLAKIQVYGYFRNIVTFRENTSTDPSDKRVDVVIPVQVSLPLCPPVPPNLVGAINVTKDAQVPNHLENMFADLHPGGQWRPPNCTARHRVAVVIPYRDREQHLYILLRNLHPMLQRQQLDYGIFVIEQAGDGPFNRAMLFNVGYLEVLKFREFDCFIFHDVDLVPENDRILYSCPEQPRHLSAAVDVMGYKLPYSTIFGGVSAMTREQYEHLNGFSNAFWGWGGEDDDMYNRINNYGLNIIRYPENIARYTMLKHQKATPNHQRFELLRKSQQRMASDGLNSTKYTRMSLRIGPLFTRVLVELPAPAELTEIKPQLAKTN